MSEACAEPKPILEYHTWTNRLRGFGSSLTSPAAIPLAAVSIPVASISRRAHQHFLPVFDFGQHELGERRTFHRLRLDDVVIEQGCVLTGTHVEEGARVHPYSVCEGARIGKEATVGPFARLRPQAHLGRGSKVGNFVEVK